MHEQYITLLFLIFCILINKSFLLWHLKISIWRHHIAEIILHLILNQVSMTVAALSAKSIHHLTLSLSLILDLLEKLGLPIRNRR